MYLRTKLYIFSALILSLSPARAQTLPALAKASEVQTGTFSNGIRYYLVTDKSACGMADCALVQVGADSAAVRDAFLSLPHFSGRKPYEFLASKGVGYSRTGYAGPDGDALLYRFSGIRVSDAAATDSTFMMMFDLCTLSPYEQAVIVSGDISAETVKGKMSIFAMTVPARQKRPEAAPYQWSPSGDVKFTTTTNSCIERSSLTFTFASPRIAAASLGTIQVLVTEKMFGELGIILKRRIADAFCEAKIPLADVTTLYRSAADGPGEESFSITVAVGKDDILKAASTVSKVLVNIDKAGVPPAELLDARVQYRAGVIRETSLGTPRDFVRECASSFLYGTTVRSTTANRDFITAKELPIETDTDLFNSFAAALFDSYENLSVCVDSPLGTVSRDRVLDAYMLPWSRPTDIAKRKTYLSVGADTLKLVDQGERVKMKSEVADPATGGTMWTFSNGLRVIWKKAETPGQVAFTFMVRGGSGSIASLGKGEGAYLSDMMYMYDVAGMKSTDFNSMLRINGIDMRRMVGVSDLRLEGTAPSGKLELLVKSVLSLAKYRRFDQAVYDEWKRSVHLLSEPESLAASVDAVMRPDYALTPYKYLGNTPSDGLPAALETYLSGEFSRFNDGIIMIAGDVSSDQVLRLFSRYGGNFPVSKVQTMRAQGSYQLKSAIGANLEDSPSGSGVTIAMSSLEPVTAERFYALGFAHIILSRRLPEALKDSGLWVTISDGLELSPMERFTMSVTARPALESGLPAGISPQQPGDAICTLREVLQKAMLTPVTDDELSSAKSMLSSRLELEFTRPGTMVKSAVLRYSEGKDFYSKCREAMGGISAQTVSRLMEELDGGCKVEYVGQ